MLTHIDLKNIKSFKDKSGVELASFTLFIGDNGSGKSSFVQILSLLSQSPSAMSLQDGQIVTQGGYSQLSNDNQKPIQIHLKGKISLEAEGFNYLNDVMYELEYQYNTTNGDNVIGANCKLKAEDPQNFLRTKLGKTDKVFFELNWDVKRGSPVTQIQFYDEISDATFELSIQFSGAFGFGVTNWGSLNTDQRIRVTAFLANISTILIEEFQNISYIPALRGIDSRHQQLLDHIQPHPINPSNFNDQSNLLASSLAYNRDLEDKISTLMEAILNRKCRSMLRQGIVVSVETFNGERWVNIMSEGFGANPLVQLVYQLVAAPSNSLILIEEPEIHLFPAAQKRLVIELIKFAKSENKRLMITTHSPHLYATLSQFKETHDDEVKIYFFERDSTTNTSKVEEITIANREGILHDFIGANIGEVTAMLEAAGI